jgi:Flp pilus assembly protein TadD
MYAWWRRQRIGRPDLWASAPFFAVSLIFGSVTAAFQQRIMGQPESPADGMISRLENSGRAVAFYFAKCIWPQGLLPIYPKWQERSQGLWLAAPWLACMALLGWLLTKRSDPWGRHVLFCLGCFLANLIPIIGLVDIAYFQVSPVADHLAYISVVPIIGLAVAAFDQWQDKTQGAGMRSSAPCDSGRHYRGLFPALMVALVCLSLAVASHSDAAYYQNEEALWSHALKGNPRSPRVQLYVGDVLFHATRLPEAIGRYQQALRLDPDYADAHCRLGIALARSGQTQAAIVQYEEALKLNFSDAITHYNMGIALNHLGRLPDAITEYGRALQYQPDFPEAHANLGNALGRSGQLRGAIAQFEIALRLEPGNSVILGNLDHALELEKRTQQATSLSAGR